MANKFKIGDTVYATGFPVNKMIVEKLNKNGICTCYWQNKDGKKQTDDYHEDLLNPIKTGASTVDKIFNPKKQ
jgi:uncharacterized protein YodC (DUF2158 family)